MYKRSLDLLVSYHDLQLMFSSSIVSYMYTYVYILEIVLEILDKLIHDPPNVCECLTLNEMHIKLASLIIFLTNDNLTNITSTPPPEVKKRVQYIVHIITLCTWEFKDKTFNLF